MIELPVVLSANGVARTVGYENQLRLGYSRNRGVYRLILETDEEWDGLTLRVFWHTPCGDPPSSLVENGRVEVPALVTAISGSGCITFEGSDGDRTLTSADLRYRVGANSGTDDGTLPEPGSPAWQALIRSIRSGDLKGDKGDPGSMDIRPITNLELEQMLI